MSRYKSPTIGRSPIFGRSRSLERLSFGRRLIAFLFDCIDIYRQRRALEALDDRMLKDIGLTRCDVEAEVSRPVWR
ncbi:DUF1127 domain-containing protein [Dongia rigui]|uniref:DUF1127 domain-containing protein n=1 Tax=Dongia rigui TaxID=940149 RepID=A0ABU5DSK7_9PROT|nr:DUF1127 domain-containing protein [Dongia rigui]MDY0870381.1 DUF1127 domain-containing protein [Dongia rigui]